MVMSQSIVMIVGSPRVKRATSFSIASYVLEGLEKKGWKTELVFAHKLYGRPDELKVLASRMADYELIGLSFPLYVDGIPAPLVELLEVVCKNKPKSDSSDQLVFSFVNSGFPEPYHSDVAVKMTGVFAKKFGAGFLGGLRIGGGGAVHGMPIESLKHRSKRLVQALDETIVGLDEDRTIPQSAFELLSEPILSKNLYLLAAKYGWGFRARRNGVKDLYARPDK